MFNSDLSSRSGFGELCGKPVTVVGAGVAGLVTATALSERGADVTILERGPSIGARACSWLAGGMLAPWCERESADEAVVELGKQALDWWPRHVASAVSHGTLVVAPPRDTAELARFARRTSHFASVDAEGVTALEPDLEGRFRQGLFFAEEAHLDPREALDTLASRLIERGADIRFGVEVTSRLPGTVVDCRGLAAREKLDDLRGVRGEMIIVRTRDITLSRPVRLLHPRIPLYIVPRGDGRYMIGATMIESEHRGPMTVRSAIELLNAAFALHPAFGEAEILEFGAEARPSFPDNLPTVAVRDGVVHVNGLYRHGFLLSPAMAMQAVAAVTERTRAAA